MKSRKLGKSGPSVGLIGLGCNNFGARLDAGKSTAVVHHALDLGINFFDCADTYGNRGGAETILGKALGPRRKDIVLATKFGLPMDETGHKQGASASYVKAAAEASLQRLATDWIDVYIVHRPDPATPIEETIRALEDLMREGKVRYTGCSGFGAAQIAEAQNTAAQIGSRPFVCALQQYSLLAREIETEIVPTVDEFGLGMVPFLPLAGGMLTGKYGRDRPLPSGARLTNSLDKRFLNEKNYEKIAALEGFCAARGRDLLTLAFSWLAGRPAVASIIAGATSREQVDANIKAADWALSAEDYANIDTILEAAEA